MGRPALARRGALVLGGVVLALCAAACSTASPQSADPAELSSWVSSNQFGQTVGTLQHDNAEVSRAVVEHKGTLIIHTTCAVLETDAGTAEGTLPTPDSGVTGLLNSAYAGFYHAAVNCYDAGATNPALLARATAERAAAATALVQALGEIEAITGRTVSTTTTTEPDDGGIFG